MNGVFITPTGIGLNIGGHAGDATPAAKLIASLCDKLIVHPNVVNASDINEMTENMLYVEGSILDKFLEGNTGLLEVNQNKILVLVNETTPDIINAISGARATIGADIEILKLQKPIKMMGKVDKDGKATGKIENMEEAIDLANRFKFDVLVVNTPIDVDTEIIKNYLDKPGGTNPWGFVEAMLSKNMSEKLNRPVIHAPVENNIEFFKTFKVVVDPRKAAEMVSTAYVHCCLKGAHKAPRLTQKDDAFWNDDIDFMVTPMNIYGRPHIACMDNNIPVIAVKNDFESKQKYGMPDAFIVVKSYLEAAGVIASMKAGVNLDSIKRPLNDTKIYQEFK